MKKLCPHSLYRVYGGSQSQGMPFPTGCPDCDGELDFEQENANASQGFATPPGWGALIGGALGTRLGTAGILGGSFIGHYIETRDYNQMGEDYINQVHTEIRNGNIPAD